MGIGSVEEQSASVVSVEVRWHLSNSAHFCPEYGWPQLLRNVYTHVPTYLPTYLPTRLYDITTQKMGLSLHLLSSCCVMYRLLLNRREGLSSTLMACAWSCSESLALSKVVLSLHATRFNSQACLFQWLSLATVLIALPHLELLADAVRGITTEHRWNTRCLNLELLGSNCS